MNPTEQTVECIIELRVQTGDGPAHDHIVRTLAPDAIRYVESVIRHPSDSTITALVRWDG